MELPPLLILSFCFLNLSGLTFAAESGTPVTRVTVKEDDGVILPCSLSTNENIESMLFDWKIEGTVPQKNVFLYDDGKYYNYGLSGQDEEFKDRVSHFPEELKHGNASIRIKKTRLEDNGTYLCKFPKLKPEIRTFRIELVVGAAQPSVTILNQTDDWALLQCDVQSGSPRPTVEWWDSNNQTIPSDDPHVSKIGDRFYITVSTTVKKDDNYCCVATQKDIWHQSQKKIYIHLNKKRDLAPQGLPVWAAILIGVLGFIVGVAVGVAVVLKVKGYCLKKGSRRKENGCSTSLQLNLNSE
ncbi:V-set domain-containing T-cell activation inhibitor 1-like isoform X2 [Simochromis diagramma]|uniref:V-set domain-containing T-cell activation inhibitor 1-like isoform X2 n=1 Tax=Simochromis diagramma TaxID=43689 RepID=UPI001A7EAFFF|nr:V-set domain-containing T-cell activation inhibitor 1-like isoform X2 [Simochromis diagramma]